ncbi:MAG: recombinase family protein [Eubacteriales bacterium]|nr:recombinase family protein [Eubacteriales bacterium]
MRPGDTLIIKSLNRLSRSKLDIKNELQYFKDNNIRIKVIDLPTTMLDLPEEQSWVIDMVNNILIEVLSSIAEQEYHTIHKRQSEGIAAAKAKGKHLGRPKLIKPENWDSVISEYRESRITAKEAMTRLNLKRSSFYKLLKSEQDRSRKSKLH